MRLAALGNVTRATVYHPPRRLDWRHGVDMLCGISGPADDQPKPRDSQMSKPPDPSSILQTAFGFWSSKVLLTAVELDLFTLLGKAPMTGGELGKKLGLHARGVWDFLDTLVAMGFLDRQGDGPEAK